MVILRANKEIALLIVPDVFFSMALCGDMLSLVNRIIIKAFFVFIGMPKGGRGNKKPE